MVIKSKHEEKPMKEKPPRLASQEVYNGWLKVRVDTLRLPGLEVPPLFDIVTINDGSAVLPFLDDNTLLLAEQYRPAVDDYLLELIQGGMQKSESPEDAARRELLEETGYAGELTYLSTMYPLPGSLDMRLHIFQAKNIRKIQEPNLDPGEELTIVTRPYQQVIEEVLQGKHKDSALGLAILFYEALSHQ